MIFYTSLTAHRVIPISRAKSQGSCTRVQSHNRVVKKREREGVGGRKERERERRSRGRGRWRRPRRAGTLWDAGIGASHPGRRTQLGKTRLGAPSGVPTPHSPSRRRRRRFSSHYGDAPSPQPHIRAVSLLLLHTWPVSAFWRHVKELLAQMTV